MGDARTHDEADVRTPRTRGCTGLDNPDEPLRCVFSSTSIIKIGTGTTAKKQKSKLLWYVKQEGVDEFGVRKINPNFVPVGDPTIIDQETLLSDYTPEVEIHNSRVEPAMRNLTKTLAKGDKHRKQGNSLSAEMEYTKALDVDVVNVRAIFGLGLVYLDRNDREKSKIVFEQLVSMEAAFDLAHKHLFNEFGIALRKNTLFDEAVKYYGRAVELSADDENLYYNLARAFYEKDDWASCFEFVSRSLMLNARQKAALDMCKLMVAISGDEELRSKYDKPPVPEEVARQAGQLLEGDEDGIDMTVTLGGERFNELNDFKDSTISGTEMKAGSENGDTE